MSKKNTVKKVAKELVKRNEEALAKDVLALTETVASGDYEKLKTAVIKQLDEKPGSAELLTTFKDITNHGADGGFSGFIYYTETIKFFDENEENILNIMEEEAQDLGEKNIWTMIGSFKTQPTNIDTLKNVLAWYALEYVARIESEQNEDEYETEEEEK